MIIQGYPTSSPFSGFSTGSPAFGPGRTDSRPGFSLGRSASQAREASKTFGREMLRRLELNGPDQEKGQERDGSALAASISRTADFIRDEFGDDASTAFMAIMARHVGDGAAGEAAIGKGMLRAVRFMDSNFGFAAGDKLINHLNGDLNNEVNAFFDNGFTERIYAFAPGQSPVSRTLSMVAQKVGERFGEEAGRTAHDMLLESLEATENLGVGMREGLKSVADYLEENFGPGATGLLSGLGGSAPPSGGEPAMKSVLLDATV